MRKQQEDLFTTIRSEGALFPIDFLSRVANRDEQLDGISAEAYHRSSEKLNEVINLSWICLMQKWANFRKSFPDSENNTSVTRERWLLPLFSELGYGWLPGARPILCGEKKYAISHGWSHVPIHLLGTCTDLDDYRSKSGAGRHSPHSLVQELLNHSSDHLWGMVSNGLRLRLLRRNTRLTHQRYIEFDLEAMMEGEIYADFVLLWLLCHQSRFDSACPEDCWLEKWLDVVHQQSVRARDQLRDGVEQAILALGQGFLANRANHDLYEKLRSRTLDAHCYHRQVLRLIYRLVVLFVAEDRDLLFRPDADEAARRRYREFYSTARLRRLAEKQIGSHHTDLFQVLQLVMRKLSEEQGCPELGLPSLDGFLFNSSTMPDLEECAISNHALLKAIRALAFTNRGGLLRPIDYKNIGVEELGSVYESLLEQCPVVEGEPLQFALRATRGNERKKSGTYFTHESLVNCLLDSALEPVLEEACRQPEPKKALLNLKICDPACGSGHFLIAAAHRIASRLAYIEAGQTEPKRELWCNALRQVVRQCIYGVDNSERAVELCMVNLCIEAMEPGKPLMYLEHNIQCGNSLIGTTPALLQQGIPNSAFKVGIGDNPRLNREYRKRNVQGQAGQLHLLLEPMEEIFKIWETVEQIDDGSFAGVQEIKARCRQIARTRAYYYLLFQANAWCAAFFWKKAYIPSSNLAFPITQSIFREIEERIRIYPDMEAEIRRLAELYNFFHWHLAFPEVFRVPARDEAPENEQAGWIGGFDVVLSNPPWERIKLQEQEWFAPHRPDIAQAPSATQRRKMIAALQYEDPDLYAAWTEDHQKVERESHFLRNCGRYPLCGRGDINIYSVFVETMRLIVKPTGRVGCIVPSGIATDDTTKFFFRDLMESQTLASLYSFLNEAKLFSDIDHRVSFALLTMTGLDRKVNSADFAFGLYRAEDLKDKERHFSLSAADIALLNPNTSTCPIFRSKRDAELTTTIYERMPVLIKEGPPEENPWGIRFSTMFHMANDSHLFRTREQLLRDGWKLEGNIFHKDGEICLPLYEGKMVWHFDHRFGTYEGQTQAQANQNKLPELDEEQHADPFCFSIPQYWVHQSHMPADIKGQHAFLVFRDIANAVVLRTAIFSILPIVPCGNTLPIALLHNQYAQEMTYFATCCSSFIFDYVARQKLGGTHMTFFILKQLPVLPPERYNFTCEWDNSCLLGEWILPRALELTYTAWDLEAFARECGYDGPPFRWDEARRFLLRCELDAAYFQLYGIARHDVDYIMETFRVWKEKEEKQYGQYRTKRVILAIYDEMSRAIETGQSYRTRLEPPPADPSVAHPSKGVAQGVLELPRSADAAKARINRSDTHSRAGL